MDVIVLGSANIDRAYTVDHVVRLGETISSAGFSESCGGKGFNQALALARAGARVSFAGAIGPDGARLKETLVQEGVDVCHLMHRDCPTGHAIIQVTPQGQNSIVIHAGANGSIAPSDVDEALATFSAGDMLVLQNEVSSLGHALSKAHEKGMRIVLNPSPLDDAILGLDLSCVSILLVNEVEGGALSGRDTPEAILSALHARYPNTDIVLTLGGEGGKYLGADDTALSFEALDVVPVDTTAAGDTFTGYLLAEIARGSGIAKALEVARVASGISVTRRGAACSIPNRSEVVQYMEGERR